MQPRSDGDLNARITMWEWLKDQVTNWGITKAYLACAVTGGGLLLMQFGLSLFGIGGDADIDGDVDVDADGDGSLGVLSIRAIAGFLTFFGLVGWAGTGAGWSPPLAALAAFAAGASVMLLIAWVMRMFKRLDESGNYDPMDAVGATAQVYLRIPAGGAGKGKVTASINGRSVEFGAITQGSELATGSACRVVRLVTQDTVEVEALAQSKPNS